MHNNAQGDMTLVHSRARRRLVLACLALAAAAMPASVLAAEPRLDPAATRVRTFYDALLDCMKRAKELGIQGRYDTLAPVIRATFDLAAMTRIAVGPSWTAIPSDQQAALMENFARMTIATYASRFDGYSGERFDVDPTADVRNADRIVRTKLVPTDGEPVTLNYLMRGSGQNWKIVDVYLSGSISELATRRSEFGAILKSGGAKALIDSLRQRGDKLLEPSS